MKITNYLLVGIALIACSCQKDNSDLESGDGVLITQNFVYQDETYAIDYYEINDSTIRIVTSENTNDYIMYEEVMQIESLASLTFTDDPDKTYYFKTANEREEYVNGISGEYPRIANTLKGAWRPFQLYFFEHTGFSGMRYEFTSLENSLAPVLMYNEYYGYGDLTHYKVNFDDKASSIKFIIILNLNIKLQYLSIQVIMELHGQYIQGLRIVVEP